MSELLRTSLEDLCLSIHALVNWSNLAAVPDEVPVLGGGEMSSTSTGSFMLQVNY